MDCIQYQSLTLLLQPYITIQTMPATFPSHRNSKASFLMLGDSLVADYNWQQRINNFSVINCGVPGATTHELLQSLPQVKAHCPSAELLLVMIGTNDIFMENYAFVEDLKKIIITLTREFPQAELLINSLLPMQLPHLGKNAVASMNEKIHIVCQETGSCYVDVYSRFTQSGGDLFQRDGVHITEAGYELWARTLLEHIAFLVEND
jgi:lysophospholipase L1-like esterase